MTNRTKVVTVEELHDNTLTAPLNTAPEPSKGSKLGNRIVYIALLVATAATGLLVYWGLQSTEVLTIKNSPFPTRTIREHPTADGVIILTADYCKNIDIKGQVRLSFRSASREIFLPPTPENGPKTCAKVEIPVLIPKEIPADTYTIHFRTTYDINPLKRGVVQEFDSKPVEIVSKGSPEAVLPTN